MIQELLVGLIFIAAVFYLGRKFFFKSTKNNTHGSCDKCE